MFKGKRKSGDSCLVRGFWGDIINSPYIPMGIEVENEEDRKKFDKEYNFQRPYDSSDIVEYHIEGYTTKLETLEDYVAPFEIIKQMEDYKNKKKDDKEENKVEEIKEESEEKEEDDEEEKVEESKDTEDIDKDEEKERVLLEGFKRLNIKIHFLTGKMANFYQKSKFKKLFNIVVLSMRCSDRLKKEFNQLLAEECYIMVENGSKLIIFDEQNKIDFVKKLKEQTKEANWKELDDICDHH